MDDLIKRLSRWGNSFGLAQHYIGTKSAREDCADAAAALTEAQETIARQQVMLDRALENGGDLMIENARLKAGLQEALDWNWLDDDAPQDVRERLWALTLTPGNALGD